jgi:transposase
MRFVGNKTIEQQDIQAIHRIRERLVKNRSALANQIRGLLAEYGIVMAQGINHIRKRLPEILEDMTNELSDMGRGLFNDLLIQLYDADNKVDEYDARVERISKQNETCRRLMTIKGVGSLTATAMIASIGDAGVFKNGREMAAFLGLVPKQRSSGGRQTLLGISKRGDRYLRCLLVHGARSVLTRGKNLSAKKAAWLKALEERRGRNRTIVALANKNARVMWALMTNNESYRAA